jgi:hypothetical protein
MSTQLTTFLQHTKLTVLPSQTYRTFKSNIDLRSSTRDHALATSLYGPKEKFAENLLKVWYATQDADIIHFFVRNAVQTNMFETKELVHKWLSQHALLSAVFKVIRNDDQVQPTLSMFRANPDYLKILMESTDTSPKLLKRLQKIHAKLMSKPSTITKSKFHEAFPQLILSLKSIPPEEQYTTLRDFFNHPVAIRWASTQKDIIVLSLLSFRNSAKLIKIIFDLFQHHRVLAISEICHWITGTVYMQQAFHQLRIHFPDFFDLAYLSQEGIMLHPQFMLETYPKANHQVQREVVTKLVLIVNGYKDARFIPWILAVCPDLSHRFTHLDRFSHVDVYLKSKQFWDFNRIFHSKAVQLAVYCISTSKNHRSFYGFKSFLLSHDFQWGFIIADFIGIDIILGPSIPKDLIFPICPTLAPSKKRKASLIIID